MRIIMMTTYILMLFAVVRADSLWSDDCQNLFTDFKARKIGDILTILVSESASATASADTKTSKSESGSIEKGTGGALSWLGPLGLSGKTSSDASGTTNRSDKLQTRLSVVVKEVMPNGDLIIEGSRFVTINKEVRKVTLTGQVRSRDVSAANTIASSLIANAQIKYDGKGPAGDKQKKGIISTLFDWLF